MYADDLLLISITLQDLRKMLDIVMVRYGTECQEVWFDENRTSV